MAQLKSYRYKVVDVFTTEPLAGNPLAVFPDAPDLDDTTMQKIARELNLAETAFVLPATREGCAARVRIFTPSKEMVFAGHPTIGTAAVLWQQKLASRGAREFNLEEKVGPVPIRVEGDRQPLIWLSMPAVREGRCCDAAICASALGLDTQDLLPMQPQLLSAGNSTLVVAAKDKAAVDRAWLDLTRLKAVRDAETEPFCVYLFTPTPDGTYSRMFGPDFGIPEDSASGSCMGPLAVFMTRHGLIGNLPGKRFVNEQGTKMGRRSLLHVAVSDGIYVGGYVVPIVEAVMTLRGAL